MYLTIYEVYLIQNTKVVVDPQKADIVTVLVHGHLRDTPDVVHVKLGKTSYGRAQDTASHDR